MINEIEVYRAYIEAKSAKPKRTAMSVATQFGLSRGGLYEIVNRIENGNASMIRRCTESSRLDCLWEYKYKAQFLAIPDDRKEATIEMLTKLIKDMSADRFPTVNIAARVGRDRSTVIHHLEKK